MTAQRIRDRISEGITLFGFEYKGESGNIDPYYTPTSGHSYLLYYAGNEATVYSIDDVMKTPYFDGKSLEQIAGEITITEW